MQKFIFNKSFQRKLRQFILGGKREKILSHLYFNIVNINKIKKKQKKIKILDFGSGFNPAIAKNLYVQLSKKQKVEISCFDFYSKKEIKELKKKNRKINFFNLKYINQVKSKKFDFVIISDVLHHIENINDHKVVKILKSLKRVSKFMIIKDHYEKNLLSRYKLIIMDFFGNYFAGTIIPKKYFNKNQFLKILKKANLKILFKKESIKIYSKKFLFFSDPNLHFIYLLR